MEYGTKLLISAFLIWVWAFFVNVYLLEKDFIYSFIIANFFVAGWGFFNTFVNLFCKKNFFDLVDGE